MSRPVIEAFREAVIEVRGELTQELNLELAVTDLGVDSLDLIEVSMILEDEYDVEFNGEDFAGVTTVGDALGVFDRVVAAA